MGERERLGGQHGGTLAVRVGLVIYGSLETQSGGYLYDRKLVEYLRAAGDEVRIFSQPWRSYPLHLMQNFEPGLARRLKEARLDVLLQDELNHPSLVWLNRGLRKRLGCPLISVVHHLRGSEQHPRVWLAGYRGVEKAYLSTLDGFLFNSQTTRRAVEGLLGGPANGVVVTPAGDRFPTGLREEEIRARVFSAGPPCLLFVGNLIPRKGLETLLRALGRLQALDWRLRIVGQQDVDPRHSAAMARLVEQSGLAERVSFLGSLSDAELEREYRQAHLLAVPSQYEGFGIVYLEGMAFGLPALGSSAGGAAEIIQHGTNGFLSAPGDIAGLARALGEILGDRARLLALSLAARRRFAEFPTWEQGMAAARAYLIKVSGGGR